MKVPSHMIFGPMDACPVCELTRIPEPLVPIEPIRRVIRSTRQKTRKISPPIETNVSASAVSERERLGAARRAKDNESGVERGAMT